MDPRDKFFLVFKIIDKSNLIKEFKENFTKDDLRQIIDANCRYIRLEEVFYQDELNRWADRNCPD